MASTLPVSHGRDIVEQAQERLRAVPNISFRGLRCECRHGLLVLRGRVESYYEKQLAQEAVARLEGIAQVVNQLEVFRSLSPADTTGCRKSAQLCLENSPNPSTSAP